MPRARVNGDGLTDKELKLILAVASGKSEKEAAIEAGYSRRNASVMVAKTLAKPRVRKVLNKLTEKVSKRINLGKKQVLRKLSDSLNRSVRDFFHQDGSAITNPHELPENTDAFVDGFRVKEYHDDPERPGEVTRREIDVRFASASAVQALVVRVKGMEAPQQTRNVNANIGGSLSDWEQLLKAAEEEAAKEVGITGEKEVEEQGNAKAIEDDPKDS